MIHTAQGVQVSLERNEKERFLRVSAAEVCPAYKLFEGEERSGKLEKICPLSPANAAALREVFPWTAPRSLRKCDTTVGCGDRLGLATYGQLEAVRKFRCAPVLAQQSMRELSLTNRTFRQVVDDACFMVFEANYQQGYGADGDHLKKISDIDVALDAGMPMITLDLSEVMNAAAGDWSDEKIAAAYAPANDLKTLYFDKVYQFGGAEIVLDAATVKRCSVMYDAALDFAEKVHAHLHERRGEEFDLEISIDETTSPTLPAHHLYIAMELRRRKVEFTSLAPRFIGEFQKAVDYIGDLAEFDRQFAVHAAISRHFDYKISVHSGSDKFAVYPTVGRETHMHLHLKTAGTSWLEAVRLVALCDAGLYRDMHRAALANFADMLKLYHITADLNKIPNVDTVPDGKLADLMNMNEARQLLHITYGPILNDPSIRGRFFECMHRHAAKYNELLEKHFEKHLSLLGVARV